jgi:hypothetical protein
MFETKSRQELAASAAVTAATVGVVMAAMGDGNVVVDGAAGAAAALVGFGLWVGVVSVLRSAGS